MKQFYRALMVFFIAIICILPMQAYDFEVEGICYNIIGENEVEITQGGEYQGIIIVPATVEYDSNTYTVTSIGDWAFIDSFYLTEITLPESVTSIGDGAFDFCISLTAINIPNTVISIGNYAFSSCDSLPEIAIPESVTSIGDWAFGFCESLLNITVDSSNKYYSSIDGVLYDKNAEILISCPGGKEKIHIPTSVTSIGPAAFYYCSFLPEITIPDSVISIGNLAFAGCSSLTEITIPDSVISIGERTFSFCDSLTEITIPESVISIGNYAFSFCDSLLNITVDPSNKYYSSIDGVLFDKNAEILISCPRRKEKIYIPTSVTSIGLAAVYFCSSLTEINLPESVILIGKDAFEGCTSLTEITIPNTVTSIGEDTFFNCRSLAKVTCLAKDLPEIGFSCFRGIDEDAVLYVYEDVLEDYINSHWAQYFTEILPIDEAGVETLLDSSLYGSYKVFNLNGVNVLNTINKAEINELPSGLYIINGKKVMIGR